MTAFRHQVVKVVTMSLLVFSLVIFHGYFVRRYKTGQLLDDDAALYKSKFLDLTDASSVEYKYHDGKQSEGQVLKAAIEILRILDMPPSRFLSQVSAADNKVVFVTALTADTFNSGKTTVASVQTLKKAHKVVVYDLGLTTDQVTELQGMCMVLYRIFDFNIFPAHVRDLSNMAWKPLILQSCLAEFGKVMWLDAGSQLGPSTSRYWAKVQQHVAQSGLVLFDFSGMDLLHGTHPAMMEYLPLSDVESGLRTPLMSTTAVLMVNEVTVYQRVTKWLVMCALNPDCLSPPGAFHSSCEHIKRKTVAEVTAQGKVQPGGRGEDRHIQGCHRFDASALNILATNAMSSRAEYVTKFDILMSPEAALQPNVDRYKVQFCILE